MPGRTGRSLQNPIRGGKNWAEPKRAGPSRLRLGWVERRGGKRRGGGGRGGGGCEGRGWQRGGAGRGAGRQPYTGSAAPCGRALCTLSGSQGQAGPQMSLLGWPGSQPGEAAAVGVDVSRLSEFAVGVPGDPLGLAGILENVALFPAPPL